MDGRVLAVAVLTDRHILRPQAGITAAHFVDVLVRDAWGLGRGAGERQLVGVNADRVVLGLLVRIIERWPLRPRLESLRSILDTYFSLFNDFLIHKFALKTACLLLADPLLD